MSKTITKNVADACEDYIKIYGANKNLYRVIPSMIDGLKPVERRILYSMYKTGVTHKADRMKLASLQGDVLHYHPHGDASVNEVMVAMGQSFGNNAMLLDPKGNFGTLAGDKAAAARYINARLSLYAWKCFFQNFNDYTVEMKTTYTGKSLEPEYLPARYPHALINGTLGIGYGLSSNIPPYNIKEVLKATIELIKDPDANIYLAPDSPTGCMVVDNGNLKEICDTGLGSYRMRANIEVDEINNILTIVDMPYQTTLNKFIETVVSNKKAFDEILDVQNQSNNVNGLRCQLMLRSDANPYKVIEKLYRKTNLEESYAVNIKLIDDYVDYDYTVKSFLLDWINYRRDIKRSSFNHMLVKRMEEYHINEILLFVLNKDNAETTISIIKKSKNKKESIEKLMKKYSITSLQASTITSMSLNAFTKESYDNYKQKKKDLNEEINKLEKLIDDTNAADNIIIEELTEGIKLFGVDRKSKILNLKDKDDTPNTEHIIAVSKDGYCKKIDYDTNAIIGKVGKNNEHFTALHVYNSDTLLVFNKYGKVAKLKVSDIPNLTKEDIGVTLNRYCKLSSDISTIVKEPKNLVKTMSLILITRNGIIKKTYISEVEKISSTKTIVNLDEKDELVSVDVISENTTKDIIVYTNTGRGSRLNANDIKSFKAGAKGLKYFVLGNDEFVIGIEKIEASKKYLCYITEKGYVKLTEMKYLPIMQRKDELMKLINLNEGDSLIGIIGVTNSRNDKKIVVRRKYYEPYTIMVKDIQITTRVSKADKMIPLTKGDKIISYSLI